MRGHNVMGLSESVAGIFELIAASTPCKELSRAKTIGELHLYVVISTVKQTFEIMQNF